MDRFTKKILAYIRKEGLIPRGSTVIIGFSGGADSVCLLSVLKELEVLLGCRVRALHVNHQLRGEESLRDEDFCRGFCHDRQIPFAAVRVDVTGFARERGLSVEEAARELRYRALSEAAAAEAAEYRAAEQPAAGRQPEEQPPEELQTAEHPAAEAAGQPPEGSAPSVLIAVAHHADDQAETILFHLIRGSGLRGMGGMSSRRGNLIRPLLETQKEEILRYVRERELPFVTDSSNADPVYARNRLRGEVLPALKSINSRAAEHLLRAGKKAEEADAYFRGEAARLCDLYTAPGAEGELLLQRKKLKDFPQILRRYVIIEALSRLGIPLKDWGEIHLEELDRLLSAPSGSRADHLPGTAAAENTHDGTIIRGGTGVWNRITQSER